ncbi:MAG TPA: Yip1 family protein, partial [Bacteroidota bacterium]|nr:Yip1 family protein [Bacteroidota bacterium]
MISCSVCGAENDPLAVVCKSCKSFLQAKVDNLNLFETLWGLMESPGATFRRIALARHKNYVIFLSSLLGISVVYAAFWYMNLGVKFSNLAILVGGGLLIGPIVGQLFTLVFCLLMHRIGRLLGGSGSFRNMHAVTAYSSSPIAYSLVFVFPIEIAIFGIYF